MKKSELREMIRDVLLEGDINPDAIRNNMPGFVGPKFAKKASDEDIIAMVKLKDEKAKIYNKYMAPVHMKIEALQKKYKVKETF